MDFEPQKFFIGIIDFFSILLPGAVLTYLFKDAVGPALLGGGYSDLQGAAGWVAFIFCSYLLGHFLFFLGSLLDDLAYDPLRRTTAKEQITRLLNRRNLSPKPLRWLAALCFKQDADAAIDRILPIKKSYLSRIDAPQAVNAFQWCKARLADGHPEALAAVNRFEADSKFFRSFIPVLLVMLARALYLKQWALSAGLLLTTGLAFLRYVELRFKSTQQAYWHVLTLESSREPASTAAPASSTASTPKELLPPTHAGGVVFRNRHSRVEYLLVQAKKDPGDWVLAKGHIEPGEDTARCAIREVREETGVWARIAKDLKVSEYAAEGETVRCQFYLMQAVDHGRQTDRLRRHEWLPLDAARNRTRYPEIKDLLTMADAARCAM